MKTYDPQTEIMPICLGLHFTWIGDTQILNYEVLSVSPNVMLEWSNHILATLSAWPVGKPIQILFNLSRPRVSIPYMIITNRNIFDLGMTDAGRARLLELLKNRTDLSGRLALLLPNSNSGAVVQTRSRNSDPAIEGRMFTFYSQAIEWLSSLS
jgi:hypothetical protein